MANILTGLEVEVARKSLMVLSFTPNFVVHSQLDWVPYGCLVLIALLASGASSFFVTSGV